jgi:hypothetical protein
MPRVDLVAPLQLTQSGSGTFLALASDGNKYWTKPPGNPQGDRTLVSEIIVAGVGTLLGAPVVPTALVDLPAGLDFAYTAQHKLRSGVGHGSLDVESAVQDDAWDSYSSRDDNRRRQARLLALWDLCMGGDAQWLYSALDDFSIWSFDHGFWLGGEGEWTIESLNRSHGVSWAVDLDAGIASSSALRQVAAVVASLEPTPLLEVVARVPVEWGASEEELHVVVDALLARADAVSRRLLDAAAQSNFA